MYDQLLVFLRHKVGHHIVATLSYQPLQDNTSLEPEVTPCVLTPAQDARNLEVKDKIFNMKESVSAIYAGKFINIILNFLSVSPYLRHEGPAQQLVALQW